MRKKNLKLFLAMVLVLTVLFAGCGGGDQEEVSGELTPAATTEPVEEKTVSMGILEGGTYTNHYTGFGFSLDSGWTIYPAEELQDLPENVKEMFEGTDLESVEFNQFTDVLAENVESLTTINVLYQKVTLQERLAYAVMDDDALIDTTLSQYDTVVEAYANGGIMVESMEKKTVTFLGEERVALHTVSTVQDVPYYILQIYDYDLGQYAIVTTVASYLEDNTESLLDLFYKVG